jgi:hypothetical protein
MMKFLRDSFVWYFPPVFLLVFLLFVSFEVFSDRVIATVQPLSIIPSPVVPGKSAAVLYQGTESKACDGVVHSWVVDANDAVYSLDDTSVFRNSGSSPTKILTFTKPFPVPSGMSQGTAEYHAVAVRWCNSFQQLLYPVRDNYSIKFEVGKS